MGPTVATPIEPITSRNRGALLLIAEGCPKTGETSRAILLGRTRPKNSVQLVLKAQALGRLNLVSTPYSEV